MNNKQQRNSPGILALHFALYHLDSEPCTRPRGCLRILFPKGVYARRVFRNHFCRVCAQHFFSKEPVLVARRRLSYRRSCATLLFIQGSNCFGCSFLNVLLRRARRSVRLLTNRQTTIHIPRNEWSSVCVAGCSGFTMATVECSASLRRPGRITQQKRSRGRGKEHTLLQPQSESGLYNNCRTRHIC